MYRTFLPFAKYRCMYHRLVLVEMTIMLYMLNLTLKLRIQPCGMCFQEAEKYKY